MVERTTLPDGRTITVEALGTRQERGHPRGRVVPREDPGARVALPPRGTVAGDWDRPAGGAR
jgi:hypothetical protein